MELKQLMQRVEDYHQKNKENGESNCWNATLVSLGILNQARWVYEKEMMEWLNASTIEIEDSMKIGDIIVFINTNNEFNPNQEELDYSYYLIHTAVYVGKDKFFHKRGSSKSEYASFDKMHNTYERYTNDFQIRRAI